MSDEIVTIESPGSVNVDVLVLANDVDVIVLANDVELLTVDKGEQGPPGGNGAPGAKGDKGDIGDPGLSGVSYTHAQAIPATTWVIIHSLNRFPSITIIDSAGTTVEGVEEYVSSNEIQLHFAAAFSGTAYLN